MFRNPNYIPILFQEIIIRKDEDSQNYLYSIDIY